MTAGADKLGGGGEGRLSTPIPEPTADATRPDSNLAGQLRVFNRSDRVWVFGYVRVLPFLLWIGGILALVIFGRLIHLPLTAWVVICATIFLGPIVLDRSPLLDPVNYILLVGRSVVVQRLGARREYAVERVERIEFDRPAGEDYDEKQRTRRFAELTIRFRKGWPARLLVTHADAVRVAGWAADHGRAVVERTD